MAAAFQRQAGFPSGSRGSRELPTRHSPASRQHQGPPRAPLLRAAPAGRRRTPPAAERDRDRDRDREPPREPGTAPPAAPLAFPLGTPRRLSGPRAAELTGMPCRRAVCAMYCSRRDTLLRAASAASLRLLSRSDTRARSGRALSSALPLTCTSRPGSAAGPTRPSGAGDGARSSSAKTREGGGAGGAMAAAMAAAHGAMATLGRHVTAPARSRPPPRGPGAAAPAGTGDLAAALREEKTSGIIECNLWPDTTMPVKPWHRIARPVFPKTPPGWLPHLPRHSLLIYNDPFCEEVPPNVQPKPPWCSLRLYPPILSLVAWEVPPPLAEGTLPWQCPRVVPGHERDWAHDKRTGFTPWPKLGQPQQVARVLLNF